MEELEFHYCPDQADAIEVFWYEDGWVLDSGYEAIKIFFCPFCGVRL